MTIKDNSTGTRYHRDNPINSEKSNKLGMTKEQILLKDINFIATEYQKIERSKQKLVESLLKNIDILDFSEFVSYRNYDIKETNIKKSVKEANIRGLNVLAVDGSSVVKNFMNVDFSFLKAIAVIYSFYQNHHSKIEYFPDRNGFNNYLVQANYRNSEEIVIDTKISIDMTLMEINLLNRVIKDRSNIDLIIIDGSIVIMPINLLFSKDPELSKKYDRLLKEYQKLYLNCKENGIILIGSIKDTRSSALANILKSSIQMLKPGYSHLKDFTESNYRFILDYFSDLDLFSRVLDKGERSCVFRCKKEMDKIRDTGIKKEIPYYFPYDFYAFYLKTTKYDTPCRIEFFLDETCNLREISEKADLISSIIMPISSLNDHYGLPIPQIEAHRRAVFKSSEIDLLFKNLSRQLIKNGIYLVEKRRNRRPF